jgi:cysteine-S-conjugate beta-lyase
MGEAMTFDFDAPVNRRGTGSLKWEACAGRDILPMWVADMDFASPPPVIDALLRRVKHGVFGYAVAPDELTEVFVRRCRERYGWPVEREWLVWLPGVVPGLSLACRALIDPGATVATFTPVYPPFLAVPGESGRSRKTLPLRRRGARETIDPADFDSLAVAGTRLLLLCSPHNPTGTVFGRAELRELGAFCRERDILVCSDEIYADLILDDAPHVPFPVAAPEMTGRSVTLLSPGKTFNLTGLNIGVAVIPDQALRRRFTEEACHSVPHPNALAYTAALAAYRDGEPWRRELLQVLRRNAKTVAAFVAEHPSLRSIPPQATYLAWIDARGVGRPDPAALFRAAGVELSSGSPFGADGFVRLNFACPAGTLDEGLARLDRALA